MEGAERTRDEPTQMRDYYLLIAHSYLYGIVSALTSFHSILFHPILLFLLYTSQCSRTYLQIWSLRNSSKIIVTSPSFQNYLATDIQI